MRVFLSLIVLAVLVLPHLLPQISSAVVDYVVIEDLYDDGRCSNCTTNGVIVNGTLALPVNGGFVAYSYHPLDRVEEVIVGVVVVAHNTSAVAVWLSPAYSASAIPGLNIEHKMVGPGMSILIDFETSTMYIMATNVQGIAYPSMLGAVDIGGQVRRSGSYAAAYLMVVYSMITNRSAYLEVSVGGSKVYSSEFAHGYLPFFEPRYVYVVGSASNIAPASAYIDYLSIRFSRYSARRVVVAPIEIEPIVLPLSVVIWRHNSTHMVVSYTCYYEGSKNECEEVSITLALNGTAVYSVNVDHGMMVEVFRGVAVFRDFVPVINGTATYRICTRYECAEGVLQMQVDEPLRSDDNPYLPYIATVIPFAVVVALAARTSNMKALGVGLVASGVAVLLLPWIMVTPPSVYAVAMALMSLGIIVLVLYRE